MWKGETEKNCYAPKKCALKEATLAGNNSYCIL